MAKGTCIHTIVYDPDVKGRMWAAGGGWSGSGHVNQSDDGGRRFRVIGIPQVIAAAKQQRALC